MLGWKIFKSGTVRFLKCGKMDKIALLHIKILTYQGVPNILNFKAYYRIAELVFSVTQSGILSFSLHFNFWFILFHITYFLIINKLLLRDSVSENFVQIR